MKVFALIILFVASASAKGSGPYLPSGWKPQGPAFYLPSEEKVNESPVNEVNLEGSEASGSDFLREYGPPNVVEISQNLVNQGLPDVVTEQTFGVIAQVEVKNEVAVQEVEVTEAKVEQTSTEQSEAAPEVVAEEITTSSVPIEEIEQISEVSQTTVANNVETDVDVTQFEYVVSSQESPESSEISQNSQTTEAANEESTSSNEESPIVENQVVSEQVSQESNQESTLISQESQSEVSETESTQVVRLGLQELQNIPDIIASLEQEVKVQQAEVNQAVSDLSKAAGELEQAPEGFLEYGPPGFAEYGPPKSDLNKEVKSEDQSLETNAARRRRFSPKFRSPKKH